jgi:UDP-N-acetylmuramoyl-tripeptide--D-alanyl-D-alanine ligase
VIPLAWKEIEQLELGALEGDGGVVSRILADSRLVGHGDLFVALNAGVGFVDDARARGAATLVPFDQLAALASLATLVRSKSKARVVAVVGSTGKTSTKDILGALCGAAVPAVWADASQNNEIGLPLTVCRLEPDTQVLVTEMGMRGLGNKGCLPQGDTLRETPGVVAPGSGRPGGVVEEKSRSRDDGWGDRSGRVAFSGHVKCGHVVRGQ